jgi:hypothetical protein
MTWVKANLSDGTNNRVEQIQEQTDMTKPEAIAYLVRKGLNNTRYENNE